MHWNSSGMDFGKLIYIYCILLLKQGLSEDGAAESDIKA